MSDCPNEKWFGTSRFIRAHSEDGRITYGWVWQDQYRWNAEAYPDGVSWSHIDSKDQAIHQLKTHYHQRRFK